MLTCGFVRTNARFIGYSYAGKGQAQDLEEPEETLLRRSCPMAGGGSASRAAQAGAHDRAAEANGNGGRIQQGRGEHAPKATGHRRVGQPNYPRAASSTASAAIASSIVTGGGVPSRTASRMPS